MLLCCVHVVPLSLNHWDWIFNRHTIDEKCQRMRGFSHVASHKQPSISNILYTKKCQPKEISRQRQWKETNKQIQCIPNDLFFLYFLSFFFSGWGWFPGFQGRHGSQRRQGEEEASHKKQHHTCQKSTNVLAQIFMTCSKCGVNFLQVIIFQPLDLVLFSSLFSPPFFFWCSFVCARMHVFVCVCV